MVVYIYITGHQNGPKENITGRRAKRNNIRSALDYFEKLVGKRTLPGYTTIESSWCKLYIPRLLWDSITKNFRDAINYPGVSVAGDEKLFHYTGHSAYVRLVQSKPERIGLLFYELCCMLDGGQPYLLDFLLQDSIPSQQISIPVQTGTYRWGSIVRSFQTVDSPLFPLLVLDSYYFDDSGRASLNERGVSFIASAQANRVGRLISEQIAHGQDRQVRQTITAPGETGAIFNEVTNEIFVHHWHSSTAIGKKYGFSNAFVKKRGLRTSRQVLSSQIWWEEYVGRRRSVSEVSNGDFAVAIHKSVHPPNENARDFRSSCEDLAEQIIYHYVAHYPM